MTCLKRQPHSKFQEQESWPTVSKATGAKVCMWHWSRVKSFTSLLGFHSTCLGGGTCQVRRSECGRAGVILDGEVIYYHISTVQFNAVILEWLGKFMLNLVCKY